MKSKENNKKNMVKEIVFISFVLVFMVVIYAPLEMYYTNLGEFKFSLRMMLCVLVPVAFALFIFISSCLFILKKVYKKGYLLGISIVFCLLVITFFQGMLFSNNLPALDGRNIDWKDYKFDAWKTILLWVVVLILVGVLYHFLKEKPYIKILMFFSGLILCVLIVSLYKISTFYHMDKDKYLNSTDSNLFTYSDTDNFIIFIVDAVDGETTKDILETEDAYNSTFDDFTFYDNVMGAYPFTSHAIPYILSGQWYLGESDFNEYSCKAIGESPLFNNLKKLGYSIDLYDAELKIGYKESKNQFENTSNNRKAIKSYTGFAKDVISLGGIKYAPFLLKRFCYREDGDYNKNIETTDEKLFSWNDKQFYDDLNNTVINKTETKQFKFIHLEGAHVPFKYDENLNYTKDGTYKKSVMATLTLIDKYINVLKENDIYNNSTILIMADHGYEDGDDSGMGRQNPALFIKQKNEQHDFRISSIPVSYEDLQSVYSRLLEGKSGDELFDYKETDSRERRYIFFQYGKENNMQEYIQTGSASDNSTMIPTGNIYVHISNETSGSYFYEICDKVMAYFDRITNSLAVSIILFTLLSKLILLPLSIWVQKNSIKMIEMQPEVNSIKIKYYGDREQIDEKMNALYKKKKYSPIVSIIPTVLQIIILFGVIHAIKSSINTQSVNIYLFGLNLAYIPYEKGIKLLFVPILAGASSFLLSYTQNKSNVLQSEQSDWNKYGTMLVTVWLSLVLGWIVSAGVAFYWIISNLMSIAQMYLLNICINPKKYIDYEALETSRLQLEELKKIDSNKKEKRSKEDRKREKQDYRRFEQIKNKHLVFYSEGNGFLKYYKGIIDYILEYTNIPIHYITSDLHDEIFDIYKGDSQFNAYYIAEHKLITLMLRLECDVMVMTMPDLDNFHIKRSYIRKDIEYINIPHGMDSINLTYRTHSVDHYDTIFCVGKHQKDEIRQTEKVYQLPEKRLIEWGYTLFDQMVKEYSLDKKECENSKKQILIAPSWQTDNIMDSCINEMLEMLADTEYYVTVRPHPQYIRHNKEKIDLLKEKFDANNIHFQLDFSSNNTVYEADILITDWSSIAYDYAYTTLRPVLFIDTPMKVMNPEYQKIEIIPFNILVRDAIGRHIALENIDTLLEVMGDLIQEKDVYREKIYQYSKEYVYNHGKSDIVGATYIIDQIRKKASIRMGTDVRDEGSN